MQYNVHMNNAMNKFTLVLLPIITLALGWQLGMRFEENRLLQMSEQLELLYGESGSGQVLTNEDDLNFDLLEGVTRLLLTHYIAPEKLESQSMILGAAQGFVAALNDPYTTFMPPEENHLFQQSLQGKMEGIGAELTLRDGSIVVVRPLKGSPALDAGLQTDDVIMAVDDTDIRGQTLSEVVMRIRGPAKTTVKLSILRPGEAESISITITRGQITIPSTEYEIKEDERGMVGYIAINQFGENTAEETESAVRDMLEKKVDGIILDVRYNGGGYLDRAVEMASLFLPQGKVVSVARKEGEPEHHYVNGRPLDTTIPIVILINEGSASASEILADALHDHERATLIGKTTYGKGTIQEIFELPGGSSLRVTTAKWLTPNGKDLSKEGVDPDIEVDRTLEQAQNDEDPQLDEAIEYLLMN